MNSILSFYLNKIKTIINGGRNSNILNLCFISGAYCFFYLLLFVIIPYSEYNQPKTPHKLTNSEIFIIKQIKTKIEDNNNKINNLLKKENYAY